MQFNIEEINRLMHARRSIFPPDYTGESVDQDIIEEMLGNATCAPTHKMTEPWRFVVFFKDGIRKLAEFQSVLYKEVTSLDGTFKEERFIGLQTKPLQSAYIISIGMKRDEKKSVPEVEEIGSVFCALENMYLTAAAHGVGCYMSTGGITYFEKAKAFFGLEPEDRLLGFLHVGIPRTWPPAKSRRPLVEVVRWVEG